MYYVHRVTSQQLDLVQQLNVFPKSYESKSNHFQDINSLFAQISKSLSKTWVDDYMQSNAPIMKSMMCKFVWLPNYSFGKVLCCGHKSFYFHNSQIMKLINFDFNYHRVIGNNKINEDLTVVGVIISNPFWKLLKHYSVELYQIHHLKPYQNFRSLIKYFCWTRSREKQSELKENVSSAFGAFS